MDSWRRSVRVSASTRTFYRPSLDAWIQKGYKMENKFIVHNSSLQKDTMFRHVPFLISHTVMWNIFLYKKWSQASDFSSYSLQRDFVVLSCKHSRSCATQNCLCSIKRKRWAPRHAILMNWAIRNRFSFLIRLCNRNESRWNRNLECKHVRKYFAMQFEAKISQKSRKWFVWPWGRNSWFREGLWNK